MFPAYTNKRFMREEADGTTVLRTIHFTGPRNVCTRAGTRGLDRSDVHQPGDRQTGLAAAAQMVGGGELGCYLTDEAPNAIVRGLPVPGTGKSPERGITRV
jgi:hypothetical protein